MRLIMLASEIPENALVTKLRGEVEYRLRDKVTVYKEGGDQQEIRADPGCRFLVNPDRGDINAIPGDKELVWEADPDTVGLMIEEGFFE